MLLYNEDKMLGAERVSKYKKNKIINKNICFYDPSFYNPLFNYGINGLHKLRYGSFSGGIKPHEKKKNPSPDIKQE
jgi:hypothetical protein